MRTLTCCHCQQLVPASDACDFAGQVYCVPCAMSLLEQGQATAESVSRRQDPTLCAWCHADQGDREWPRSIADHPTCLACETRMRNHPYPTWLKGAFLALLAIVLADLVYNWRFVDALHATKQSDRSLDVGELDQATLHAERAARDVPESQELRGKYEFVSGLNDLQGDEPESAVKHFAAAQQILGMSPTINAFMSMAQASAAFDRHDYEEMARVTDSAVASDPTNQRLLSAQISAAACLYASTGIESHRTRTLELLKRFMVHAKELDLAALLENRIQHRLATREIIDTTEFQKRFPEGWSDPHIAGPVVPAPDETGAKNLPSPEISSADGPF